MTTETKVNLVKRYIVEEISQSKGAEAAGVSVASFQQWIMKYEAEGIAAFYREEKNKQYDVTVFYSAMSIDTPHGGIV